MTPEQDIHRVHGHRFVWFSLVVIGLLLPMEAWSQSTYTWTGPPTGLWTAAANWTPNRTTPASNDVIVFDGALIPAPLVTGVTNQTIGRLVLVNGTTTSLQGLAGSPVTLAISGGAGVDLDIPAGTTLFTQGGTGRISLALGAGASGLVAGSLEASGQVTASAVNSLVFTAGSQFTHQGIPGANAFGTASLNSVIFESGSTYISSTGGHPFGAAAPASVVTFQTGSLYRHSNSADLSLAGRTYADLEVNAPGGFNQTATGSQALTVDDLRVLAGSLFLQVTTVNIKGDMIESGGTLDFNPGSAQSITLNGTSPQQVQGSIGFNTNTTLVVSNPAGVTWQAQAQAPRNLTMSGGDLRLTGAPTTLPIGGQLTLINGIISTGTRQVHLQAGSTVTGGSNASHVYGNLRKAVSISAGATQRNFEVGDSASYAPVTLSFPSVSVAGDLTVSTSAGDHAQIAASGLDATRSVNRSWSIANSATVFAPCAATFTFSNSDLDAGTNTANLEVRKFSSPATWTPLTTGTRTGTSTQATSIIAFDSPASEFALAEPLIAITSSAGAGGSITPAGQALLQAGSDQLYSIEADPGFGILDVLVDGISQGAVSSYTFTNVSTGHTIAASFTPTGATATFAGVVNTGLGGAALHVTAGGVLVVSNIGSSGNDGVSFPASDPDEGHRIEFAGGLELDPAVDQGGSLVVEMVGTAAGLEASLGSIRADVVSDGIDITPDFAEVGASDVHVEAFLDTLRQHSCRVPNGTVFHREGASSTAQIGRGGAGPFATRAAGDGIGGVEVGLKKKPGGQLLATLKFTGTTVVNVNGVLVSANRLQFTALAPKQPLSAATARLKLATPPAAVSNARALAATHLAQVAIAAEPMVVDSLGAAGGGIHVERLGGATFTSASMDDGTTVVGIGSSGNDGVDQWLDSSTGATHTFGDGMGFSTATDAGAFLEHRLRGKLGCVPDSTVAIGTETVYADSIVLRSDFSRLGASAVMITILDEDSTVHEATYSTGQSVRLVESTAGLGFGARAASINTTRSNIKEKSSILGSGVRLGWTYKRPLAGPQPRAAISAVAMPFDLMIGASRYRGDEVRFAAVGGSAVTELTGASLKQKNPGGTKLDTLRLGRTGISVGASAASNVARGAAGLLAVGGKVVVHNIGMSAQDGVECRSDKPSPVISLRLSGTRDAAELPPGASMKISSVGSRAGITGQPVSSVGVEKSGAGLRMAPRPLGSSPAGSSPASALATTYRMEVLLNEVVVAVVEAETPEVDFDRLPDQAFGTASGSALQFRWDTPLTLALVGGASQSGNGLRIQPLGVPDDVESLSAVAIDAAGFGSFEVSDLLAPVLDVGPRPQPSAGLSLVLGQNPVRRGEALELTLVAANAEWIDLDLYDAQGRRVVALFHGVLPAGLSRRSWTPAREVTSGLYFLRLRAHGVYRSEKVVLIK